MTLASPNAPARRVRIALLLAQPESEDYPRLKLDREFNRICTAIRRARPEQYLELWPYPRATREDLHQAILAGPDILHIASHGQREGIILHAEHGKGQELVPLDELSELLSWHTPADRPLQCAILNACWSAEIGLRRALRVPYTVGMQEEVYDPAAIEFTCGFYDALGAGHDYVAAFQHGRLRGRRYAEQGDFHPLLLQARTGAIGVRSFMQDAEDLQEQTELLLQLEGYFEGRALHPDRRWSEVAEEIARFCSDPELRHRFRTEDFQLHLYCHLSIALLAGYMFGFEAPVAPLQGRHRKHLWARPEQASTSAPSELVVSSRGAIGATQIAVAVSISRPITDFVERYLATRGDFRLIEMTMPFPNPRAIAGPEQADAIVEQIVHELARARVGRGDAIIHLFVAGPAALMFLLGQHQYALGHLRVYELDYTRESDGTYTPSIDLPLIRDQK